MLPWAAGCCPPWGLVSGQWRTLQRWIGRREYFQETALAIAGLVSDRTAAR
jgi:hypothetical protein